METKQLSTITDTELTLTRRLYAQGYHQRLVAEQQCAYEGFDVFYAYNDKWDMNIHAVGQKVRTIYVVAYPQSGWTRTAIWRPISNWVEIGQYHTNGYTETKGDTTMSKKQISFFDGENNYVAYFVEGTDAENAQETGQTMVTTARTKR
jgi:hypothetical protein